MRRLIIFCFLFAGLVASIRPALAKDPARDVLGVRPGMSADEARRRLNRLGRAQTADRMKHEVWEVEDSKISHVGVRIDIKTKVVRWITAIARTDATSRLRYDDVGDIKSAQYKTDGRNHTYIWRVPKRGKQPGYVLEALGSDPEYLTSYRLLRTFE